MKTELDTKISGLIRDVDSLSQAKRDLESTVKQFKTDNEKLNSGLRSITRAKDQLEASHRIEKQRLEKEMSIRDDKLSEMQSQREVEIKASKKLHDQKEQLLFQVTDLQNSLDREASTVNSLNFELSLTKKNFEESNQILEDNVEKLNVTRVNLTNDKRQLMEKVKQFRTDLAAKEAQCNTLTETYTALKQSSQDSEGKVKAQLNQLYQTYKKQTTDFTNLDQKYKSLSDQDSKMKIDYETLNQKFTNLNALHTKLISDNQTFKTENATLTGTLKQTEDEKADLKAHLDSVLVRVTETNDHLNRQTSEYRALLKDRDTRIAMLSTDLFSTTEQVKKLTSDRTAIDTVLVKSAAELQSFKENLENESAKRLKLEVTLDDLRTSFSTERKNRIDLERVQLRLNRRDNEKDSEMLRIMNQRNRLLASIEMGLNSELKRLSSLSSSLPDKRLLSTPEPVDFSFLEKAEKKVQEGASGRGKHFIAVPRLGVLNIIEAAQDLED